MYHNLNPDVYIESDNPSIIHVKRENITWGDFFATLPISLTPTCLITGTKETFCTTESKTLRFTLNGQNLPDTLDKTIMDGDKLLVTFGTPV